MREREAASAAFARGPARAGFTFAATRFRGLARAVVAAGVVPRGGSLDQNPRRGFELGIPSRRRAGAGAAVKDLLLGAHDHRPVGMVATAYSMN